MARLVMGVVLLVWALQAAGGEAAMHMHRMHIDANGSVMNANDSTLPRDCARLSGDVRIEVEAGTRFARNRAGQVFGYSRNLFHVEPCSRITVSFHNDDEVRHQWMVHGLPRYLYPGGMFHLEAAGGQTRTGTFIVPSDDKTYLVHCDIAQHMEKGMKAELVVGRGSGDLWAVPGVSAPFNRASYGPRHAWRLVLVALAVGAVIGLLLGWRRAR